MTRVSQCCLRIALPLFVVVIHSSSSAAAIKPHIISFGKWTTVQWLLGTGGAEDTPLSLKVRPLLLDGRVKEFTFGSVHDITDRLLVVRRAFRINDALPQDSSAPHWQWQRGGWLLVDRVTGHISVINLAEFDAVYSAVSWYRDYAAYCGVSDDGKKIYAIVAQLSRRKPVLKKLLAENTEKETKAADSACPEPAWQRSPTRVTFQPASGPKQTFAIRGHAVGLVTESEDQEDEEASNWTSQ